MDVQEDVKRLCTDLGVRYAYSTRYEGRRHLLKIYGEVPELLARALADRGWHFDDYGDVFVLDGDPRL